MPLTRVPAGNHPETGAPGYAIYVNPDPTKVLYYTGPLAMGDFLLKDGTVYNVSDHAIQVESFDHAYELDHHLAKSYLASGVLQFEHACAFCDATDAYVAQKAALASSAAENAALNGLAGTGSTNVMPDVSLHTATTSTTGASENANSGSYARQAATWATASAGSIATSASLTFATGGSVAVTYAGTWSSASYGAGTFAIGAALTAGVTSTSIVFATAALSFTCT